MEPPTVVKPAPFASARGGAILFLRLFRAWKKLQVSYYGGKYSVHRALALEAYSKDTSLFRAVVVCLLAPVPIVAFVIGQESIPLQDPRDGWRANYGFWIRSAILAFVVPHTFANQATYFIDEVSMSVCQLIMMSACTSVLFTASALAITPYLIFPVPFFVLTMAPLFYVCLVISLRIVVGRQIFHSMEVHRGQFVRYMSFILTQNLIVSMYPAYETLFRFSQGSKFQLPVILLLPLIKIALKNVVLRSTTHMEDMMPEAVIFSVDFFNAFYVATCMQSASSAAAITTLTVTDLSQTIIMLTGLHYRTGSVWSRLRHLVGGDFNLVSSICRLCRDPKLFERQSRTGICIRSCLHHKLSAADCGVLDKLVDVSTKTSKQEAEGDLLRVSSMRSDGQRRELIQSRSFCARKRLDSIHPIGLIVANPSHAEGKSKPISETRVATYSSVLRDSLETLFTTECLIVTAYLEAAIPLLYCCYMLVMLHLPSARYHSEMVGVTAENIDGTLFPVVVFGLLQIASFALLIAVIKRYTGIQAAYQLAFVLETQMPLIQGKLMIWMVGLLCFRVEHFGVDFTFKFELSK